MLDYSHNFPLVAASLAIALMAGFTGLSLTRGASDMTMGRRKLVVAMSSIALGGGVWSMHFVAMLGLKLPVLFYYDALITLISALLAILITGIALLIVHFGQRTQRKIVLAGAVVGVGIPVMHYVGMSGIQMCAPVYTTGGILLALAASLALSIAAFCIAYGNRDTRHIILGTIGFGLAVFSVHFIAMAGTGFIEVPGPQGGGARISNEVLAFGVTLAAFLISSAFLLTGVNFAETAVAAPTPNPVPPPAPAPRNDHAAPDPERDPGRAPGPEPASQTARPGQAGAFRLPYEKEGRTHFIPVDRIAAIRAEGHYTILYSGAERLFCPWSITEAEARVKDQDFIRCHRSYLVNRRHVSGFERKKDTGVCFFESIGGLDKVPVSRSRLHDVREHLGV